MKFRDLYSYKQVQTMDNQDRYTMESKPRGLAVILNITDTNTGPGPRKFSNFDESELTLTLNKFGFQVKRYQNKNKMEILDILKKVSEEDHSKYDCFMCFMMSWGDYGVIDGKDEPVHADEFLEYFKGDTCPQLAGKPKVFIFQACNPLLYTRDEADDIRADSQKKTYTIPSEADFLMVWSLVPGDLFETTKPRGSIFIQSFCQRLKEARGQEEINRILTRVLRDVNEELETKVPNTYKKANYRLPVVINMLTKLMYLELVEL